MNAVSGKIDSGQGTVGALINSRSLYDSFADTNETLHATMLKAQVGVTDFQENMEALKHNFFLSGYFKKRGYLDSGGIAANRIGTMPEGVPQKAFEYSARELFDSHDSAKLRNQKLLKSAGEFLAQQEYGFAVVVVSSGMQGDTAKELLLTEARAMVVREYLVENFGFDDVQLKTLGRGKQASSTSDAEWGSVQILIYSAGTVMPADKTIPVGISSNGEGAIPVKTTGAGVQEQ